MLEFNCTACLQRIQVAEAYQGQRIQCPICRAVILASTAPGLGPQEMPSFFRRHFALLIVGAVAVTLVGLWILSAVRDARAAALLLTINHMKQIGLGIHAFQDANRRLPTPRMTTRNAAGQFEEVDLSWRVTILPFVEESVLMRRFQLTSGWDAPGNSDLQDDMPGVYVHMQRSRDPKKLTCFQYFTGSSTLFPDNLARKFTDIRDGTGSTLMFAEALEPVVWTRPLDMSIAGDRPLPLPAEQFHGCMADGFVRTFERSKMSETLLRELLDPADGKPADGWDK